MSSTLRHTPDGFRRLMRRAKIASEVSRGIAEDEAFALDLPAEVGIKLNNGCNLRCSHCFEWNEDGYHQSYGSSQKRAELPMAEISRLLDFTHESKAPLYLWGGEPLMYSQFSELVSRLSEERRWTTICTNGILLEKRMDDLLRLSPDLALLISLEGLAEANDKIRGPGTFKKVLAGIDRALELRAAGLYKGTISISLTINDGAVDTLAEFVQFFDARGIDSIYLVFPWFVPPEIAHEMDHFASHALPNSLPVLGSSSWHSFTFHVSPQKLPALREAMAQIDKQTWHSHVRFHPHLKPDEVTGFVLGSKDAAENKSTCHAIRRRMDVLPNGDIVSCKFYPESRMGNMTDASLLTIWKGEQYRHFRTSIASGLSPVCSKCTLLYTTG